MALLGLSSAALPKGADALNQVIDKLSRAISVHRLGLTFLFEIAATSSDPEKSARIANAVAEAYVADQVSAKIQNTLTAHDILEGQLNSASAAVTAAEQSFDDYIQAHIDTLAKDSGRTDIALLRDELADSMARSQQQSALIAQVQASIREATGPRSPQRSRTGPWRNWPHKGTSLRPT